MLFTAMQAGHLRQGCQAFHAAMHGHAKCQPWRAQLLQQHQPHQPEHTFVLLLWDPYSFDFIQGGLGIIQRLTLWGTMGVMHICRRQQGSQVYAPA